MRNKIFVLSNSIVSRSIPIVLGIIALKYYGAAQYASYVFALSFANVIIAVSLLSICPLILGTNSLRGYAEPLARIGFVLSLIIGTCTFAILPKQVLPEGLKLFAWIYFVASLAFGITQALLNSRRNHLKALIYSIIVSVMSVALPVSYLGSRSETISGTGFEVIIIPYGVLSILLLFLTLRGFTLEINSYLFDLGQIGKQVGWHSVLSGLFGGLFMLGFFLVNNNAMESSNESYKVCLALALQLFTVTVFIPGAMSSYFVPSLSHLTDHKDKYRESVPMIKMYILIGLVFCLLVAAMLPLFFKFYQIPNNALNYSIVLLIQISAVVAAANAALTQFSVSISSYSVLLLSSIVWFSVLILCLYMLPSASFQSASSLLIAYLVSTAFIYLCYSRQFA